MPKSLYMVVEVFKGGDALPVYRRLRERGRLAPKGLVYVSSWVDTNLERCYQLMETDDLSLLDEWISNWSDLIDFEVHPVITSSEAAERDGRGSRQSPVASPQSLVVCRLSTTNHS
jgi:hypothetical protein